MQDRSELMAWLALPAVLLLTVIAYEPGLHGAFLFDDFGNLPALGAGGPVDHWPTFWRYITSGTADPTGRPLTMLTFLIDARNWPADPYPFKRTSLILHLVNGTLLYALLAQLGQRLNIEAPRYKTAALLGTALWLLHPLFVSTTLYIVQREAMLPATCVLAGLLIWMHGRAQLLAGQARLGLLWGCVGLGGFTVLGVLAKANGALLPLYALLVETIVLAPRMPVPAGNARRCHRVVIGLFAALPSAAIIIYLGRAGLHGILLGGNATGRPWTYAQRLLTEPRVLMDYLSLLWMPTPFSSGLFNDQYVASQSLWHPISTVFTLIAITILICCAWTIRRRYPALALAILFYFAGQLIESSSLALELYFEHRNYLPAMLMFWPLGLWLSDNRKFKTLKLALIIALPVGLALMTYERSTVWGDVQTQALIWAKINPHSARAQANAADIEMQAGHPQAAIARLNKLLLEQPEQAQLALNLIKAHCMSGGIRREDFATTLTAMRNTPNTGALFEHWFDSMLPVVATGGCSGLTMGDLSELINAGLQNSKLTSAGAIQDLTYLQGRISLAEHQPDAALTDFKNALDVQVRPGMALQAAATLGAAGYPASGTKLLDYYQTVRNHADSPVFGMPALHEWVLTRQNYWPDEITHLRRQLRLDASAGTPDNQHSNPGKGTP
jgi:tetratricopeptide (TPR) repeat protein